MLETICIRTSTPNPYFLYIPYFDDIRTRQPDREALLYVFSDGEDTYKMGKTHTNGEAFSPIGEDDLGKPFSLYGARAFYLMGKTFLFNRGNVFPLRGNVFPSFICVFPFAGVLNGQSRNAPSFLSINPPARCGVFVIVLRSITVRVRVRSKYLLELFPLILQVLIHTVQYLYR